MALITTLAAADADSYGTLEEAAAYHTARGNTAWGDLASDAIREQHMRKAADYMLQAYRTRWAGTRTRKTQRLDWPRYDVPMQDGPGYGHDIDYYPNDSIPGLVKEAQFELALRSITTELLPDEGQAVLSERIGPMAVTYQEGTRSTPTYPAIDRLLAPVLAAGLGLRVVRS